MFLHSMRYSIFGFAIWLWALFLLGIPIRTEYFIFYFLGSALSAYEGYTIGINLLEEFMFYVSGGDHTKQIQLLRKFKDYMRNKNDNME